MEEVNDRSYGLVPSFWLCGHGKGGLNTTIANSPVSRSLCVSFLFLFPFPFHHGYETIARSPPLFCRCFPSGFSEQGTLDEMASSLAVGSWGALLYP